MNKRNTTETELRLYEEIGYMAENIFTDLRSQGVSLTGLDDNLRQEQLTDFNRLVTLMPEPDSTVHELGYNAVEHAGVTLVLINVSEEPTDNWMQSGMGLFIRQPVKNDLRALTQTRVNPARIPAVEQKLVYSNEQSINDIHLAYGAVAKIMDSVKNQAPEKRKRGHLRIVTDNE